MASGGSRRENMKSEFNGSAGDKSVLKLVRLLARQAAECDYEEHLSNTSSTMETDP